jgi:hypothetical protein
MSLRRPVFLDHLDNRVSRAVAGRSARAYLPCRGGPHQIVRFLAAAAAVACAATVALAAEQTILGKALTVKDTKPGVDLTKRRVDVTGKEKNSPNTLVGNPTPDDTAPGGQRGCRVGA